MYGAQESIHCITVVRTDIDEAFFIGQRHNGRNEVLIGDAVDAHMRLVEIFLYRLADDLARGIVRTELEQGKRLALHRAQHLGMSLIAQTRVKGEEVHGRRKGIRAKRAQFSHDRRGIAHRNEHGHLRQERRQLCARLDPMLCADPCGARLGRRVVYIVRVNPERL